MEDVAVNVEATQRRVASVGGGTLQVWDLKEDSKSSIRLLAISPLNTQ